MKCLETRTRADGFRHRTYRDADGALHRTIEVPIQVWNGLNKQGRGNDRAASHSRLRERLAKRAEAERLMSDGWKPIAVSHEMELSLRTLYRWRRTLKGQ